MVDVRVGQLRRSRDRLELRGDQAANEGDSPTAGLLLFYSAECGLKAEVLHQKFRARDTSQLPKRLRNHDLRALAKELNLPGSAHAALDRCKRTRYGPPSGSRQAVPAWVGPDDLHQAWRYGADLEPGDEQRALTALRTLIAETRR
ncbi:hypothetical protein [Streptomyces sp. NPDC014733]|uniref:hypothetical protein n=1 Tax=Streptomyces sp. NPDC014733 TaxID=3364885 RepID=UPI003702F2DA